MSILWYRTFGCSRYGSRMRRAAYVLLFAWMTWGTFSAFAEDRYTGPIIDAHGHLGASFRVENTISALDTNNVSKQIIMARYYPGPAGSADRPGSDELALEMAQKYPGRFFPLVGMQRPELTDSHRWSKPDKVVETILQQAEEKLATGHFWGIGEVIVKHYAYSSGRHAEQENPIYSPFMQRLSRLAAQFDVPIILHMEGAPQLVEDLARLLRENPGVRYVWAHNCGRSRAPVIRAMLGTHPNLFCDLAGMTNVGETSYGIGWPRMEEFNSLMEADGKFLPEMREIYESFPDRFMLGMDVAHAPGMNLRNYSRRVARFRELLGQLSGATAKNFAELNALRIFKLETKVSDSK
jgi:Tat protein secretion system quality control protein TatD with DNase activity